jgi:hypothetical protein
MLAMSACRHALLRDLLWKIVVFATALNGIVVIDA